MDVHNLALEFPEYKDKIHTLKIENSHFKALYEKFHVIDKAIVRSEQRIDLLSDEKERAMRKERLEIKDELLKMLKD